ncbi:MAG: ribosome maturation factor RimP [Firmicutes bacterium]|nr:ribosome maturation factor RimP [Bacillota bacterium]
MSKLKVEQAVEELLLPIMDDVHCELVDIEYKKEGSQWYLRIYIDKPGGIIIDDCQIVSERISDLLDKSDPIPYSYFLEVSSPGLDRILKKDSDFEKYKGSKVDISLFKPMNGKRKYSGELVSLINDELVIRDKSETISFKRSDIAVVRLAVEF